MHIKPGMVLSNKYEILDKIGDGGMGAVYRAKEIDFDVGRTVAIKVLPAQMAADERLVERFKQEIKIAATLDHPHIVPIYFVGQEAESLYFVMKHIKGETLKSRISRTGRLEPAVVIKLMMQIGGAMEYIHLHGAIHRDIKSVNIMFDEADNAMLMDFGIAKMAGGATLTADGEVLGTAAYMAPEQWEGSYDHRSDIYSLGVVMYETLSGRPPFTGDRITEIMVGHLRRQPIPLRTLRPQVSERLAAIVHRCLEKEPEKRFQSCSELVHALEEAQYASHRMNLSERELAEEEERRKLVEARTIMIGGMPVAEEPTSMPAASQSDPTIVSGAVKAAPAAEAPKEYPQNIIAHAPKPQAAAKPAGKTAKPHRGLKRLLIVGGVFLLFALLFFVTVIFNTGTGEWLTKNGHRLYSRQWYGSPPLLNAVTAYKLALWYDPDNSEAATALHNMAMRLAIEGNNYYVRGDLDRALDYFDWATDAEKNTMWIKMYNKIYDERKVWK